MNKILSMVALVVVLLGYGSASAAPYALKTDISLIFGGWEGPYTIKTSGDKTSTMGLTIGDTLPFHDPWSGYFMTPDPAEQLLSWSGTYVSGAGETIAYTAQIQNSFEILYTADSTPTDPVHYWQEEILMTFSGDYALLTLDGTGGYFDGVDWSDYGIAGSLQRVVATPLPPTGLLLAVGVLGSACVRERMARWR